jgi:hypothetical protein
MTARNHGTVFVITLRVPASADAVKTIRLALKRMWRDYGLRCIGIEERNVEDRTA